MEVERWTESTIRRSKSTISAWETGRSSIDIDGLRQLDDCYEADGALLGLVRAMQSPSALSPRMEWAHNFQPSEGVSRRSGGPVWVWLRPSPEAPDRLRAVLWWGVLGIKVDQACGPDGLVITCPISTHHPAAHVRMVGARGWADFGRGPIPTKLNMQVVTVLPRLQFFGARQAATSAFSDALHSILGSGRIFERLAGFAGVRSDVIQQALVQFGAGQRTKDLTDERAWHTGLDPMVSFEPSDYRRFREARVSLSKMLLKR